MKDKQIRYLDNVVELLVDDTEITIEGNDRSFKPSFTTPNIWYSTIYLYSIVDSMMWHKFVTHCKNIYGLTGQEIEYVWEEYRSILTDKFGNER
jgi:hypothetical protein